MDKRRITTIILYLVGVVLLIWDIIVASNDMRDDTISEIIRDTSYKIWFLPWAFGGVMGHLFWNKKESQKPNVVGMVSGSIALVIANLIVLHQGCTIGLWVPLAAFVGGFVAGHFWWPQKAKEL